MKSETIKEGKALKKIFQIETNISQDSRLLYESWIDDIRAKKCLLRILFLIERFPWFWFLSLISKITPTKDETLSPNNGHCAKLGHFLSAKFSPLKCNLLYIPISIIQISVRISLSEYKFSPFQYTCPLIKKI